MIFYKPFSSVEAGVTTPYQEGKRFTLASICDAYPRQGELADCVTAYAKMGAFDKLVLCSGAIGTPHPPIGAMSLWRLTDESRLGPDFAKRVIYDPRSVNSITDFTIPLEHAKNLLKPDEDGTYEMLFFTRPFHAIRCLLTSQVQTPELKPTFVFGSYALSTSSNFQHNPEILSWMWSELPRLVTYSEKGDIARHPLVANTKITATHQALDKHLRMNLRIDPATIARGVPQADKIVLGGQEVAPEVKRVESSLSELWKIERAITRSMPHPHQIEAIQKFEVFFKALQR